MTAFTGHDNEYVHSRKWYFTSTNGYFKIELSINNAGKNLPQDHISRTTFEDLCRAVCAVYCLSFASY